MIDRDLHHALDDYPACGQLAHRVKQNARLKVAFIEHFDTKTGSASPVGVLDYANRRALLDGREKYDEMAQTLDDRGYTVDRRGGDQ